MVFEQWQDWYCNFEISNANTANLFSGVTMDEKRTIVWH